MKIETLALIAIIFVTAADAFNDSTTAVSVTTKKPRKIEELFFNATDTRKNCSMRVLRFKRKYLQGAKYPNLISYNNTNLKECHQRCCYEQSFECKSYSYFKPLRQCFVMNLTRKDEGMKLNTNEGYVHLQVMPDLDEMTTIAPDETTEYAEEEKTTSDVVNPTTLQPSTIGKETTTVAEDDLTTDSEPNGFESSTRSEEETVTSTKDNTSGAIGFTTSVTIPDLKNLGPDAGVFQEPKGPEKMVDNNQCPTNCSNNGLCESRESTDEQLQTEAVCNCFEGFEGATCDTKVVETEEGFPVWIIVVIVIGVLILILIVVACVLLRLYKQKGEYRVVDYIRRWTRRDKKPSTPDNKAEIAHMDDSNDPFPPNARSHGITDESTRTAV